LLWDTYLEKYRWIADVFDCDDRGIVLHAFVIQQRYYQIQERKISKEEWFPWALGEVWASMFRGKVSGHAINICLTRDAGLLLIEPQTDQMWSADREKDRPYFIRI